MHIIDHETYIISLKKILSRATDSPAELIESRFGFKLTWWKVYKSELNTTNNNSVPLKALFLSTIH